MTRENELKNIFAIRNSLIVLQELDAIVDCALEFVQEHLQSQSASIFLFSKEGYLERVAIRGTNAQNKSIGKDWFHPERYLPGSSFTGKAVQASSDDFFGQPQYSTSLDEDEINLLSKNAYERELMHMSGSLVFCRVRSPYR
jgi:hypothetical protein